jgi:hypothetical protein
MMLMTDTGPVTTPGCPADGREYTEIEPSTDTLGERIVKYHEGAHTFGRAVSHPTPGEHIKPDWPVDKRAAYWVRFVSDDDLGAYLRGDQTVGIWVRITRVWLVPNDGVPAQRTADNA